MKLFGQSRYSFRDQIHLCYKRPDCKCLFNSEALVIAVPSIAPLYPADLLHVVWCPITSEYPKDVIQDDLGRGSTSRNATATDILLACQQEKSNYALREAGLAYLSVVHPGCTVTPALVGLRILVTEDLLSST